MGPFRPSCPFWALLASPAVSLFISPGRAIHSARRFLRPIGWRGKTPFAEDLEGSIIFERDRIAVAPDDTEIAYSVYGESGPWIALVPGFVCPDNFWKYLLPELAADHRVIVYDLRGLGRSGTPRAPGYRAMNLSPADFAIPKQTRDLEAILDQEGVDRITLIGHSMGGQIILEAWGRDRERITGLVMLTAPFESPMRTFYGRDLTNVFRAVRAMTAFMPRPAILGYRALILANPSITHQGAMLMRSLGPEARLDDMIPYYNHMAFLDPFVVLMMAESMRAHSAASLLPQIDIPFLIVSADLDTFTPPAVATVMHEAVLHSELVTIPGAGHAAVIEKPTEINNAVRNFLTHHSL